MKSRDIEDIDSIVLHCSDSGWGDVEAIRSWHLDRGWDDIGYNYVLLNGYAKSSSDYIASHDGKIETGRPLEYWGSHCLGRNHDSIGICLIGINDFTSNQFGVMLNFLEDLCVEHDIDPDRIFAHYEFSDKTCPNFDVSKIREIMKERL